MDTERVIKLIRGIVKDRDVEINPDSKLREEIGIKSIDIVNLIGCIEEEYDIEIEMSQIRPQIFQTVGTLCSMICNITGGLK